MKVKSLTLIIGVFLVGCQTVQPTLPQPEGLYRPINQPKPAPVALIEAPKPAPVVVKKVKKVKRHGK